MAEDARDYDGNMGSTRRMEFELGISGRGVHSPPLIGSPLGSGMNHKTLGHSEHPLTMNDALWKHAADFGRRGKPNGRDLVFDGRTGLAVEFQPREWPSETDGPLHPEREKLETRKQEVRLDRKVAVRRLDPVPLTDARDFNREPLLG
jgi:hypothetical protein